MVKCAIIQLGGMGRSGRCGRVGRTVSSSKSTGLRTQSGAKVRNAAAYSATGATTYTKSGQKVSHPIHYAKTVQGNSMKAAADKVRRMNPKATFTYTAHLPGGKKYVGMTSNPVDRITAHHTGKGASATLKHAPESVTFQAHPSRKAAKAAETRTYFNQKAKHGSHRVRGAGHTKPF